MGLPICIGKDSSGRDVYIDVAETPLLMISYCREEQLGRIFKQFNHDEQTEKHYMITTSRRFYQWGIKKSGFVTFLRDMPSFDMPSRAKMLQDILKEINKRQLAHKQFDVKKPFGERYVFIDDVWDIITSKPRKNAMHLMLIMLYGPEVGIRTVFASIVSYMNLLQQLIHVHPELTAELQKRYGTPEPRLISEVGHELIFSMEDFIYYRKGMAQPMERYYKSDTLS